MTEPTLHWLVVDLEDIAGTWPPALGRQAVKVVASPTLQEITKGGPFRTSPIFPLGEEYVLPTTDEFFVFFYTFDPAFKALANIKRVADAEVVRRCWISAGLASCILITEADAHAEALEEAADATPRGKERWQIRSGALSKLDFQLQEGRRFETDRIALPDYAGLSTPVRAALDEFSANLAIVLPKILVHAPSEADSFLQLADRIRTLVEELVYLQEPTGRPPRTLREYRAIELREDAVLRATISHQAMDRIVQVNAALAYVSTQALSGAIPVLERRSLIRRHSLLGVGNAVTGLTRIARSIEKAFAAASLEVIITDRMRDRPLLPGTDHLPAYDTKDWGGHSVARWSETVQPRDWFPKLAYYSGRLGFRETEFTISAAIQSLVSGADLEWSLLTITHELLHGHVRNIITSIFQGDPEMSPARKRDLFYTRFRRLTYREEVEDSNQLDSLRQLIFSYCCLTKTHGSLSRSCPGDALTVPEGEGGVAGEITRGYYLLSQDALWTTFEEEYRNINEILVHVLDLHYFYAGRLSAYVPLIWSSWGTVPHVRSDLRHYVLRSLLAIASKERVGGNYDRFDTAVSRLLEILESVEGVEAGIVRSVRDFLEDKAKMHEVFYPFSASLMLVDLAAEIFTSPKIRAALLDDPLVRWVDDAEGFEDIFEYDLPPGFRGGKVRRPAALLLHRMLNALGRGDDEVFDWMSIEHRTVELFLACASGSDWEGTD